MLDKLKDDINKQIPESLILDYAMLKGLEMKKSDRYISINNKLFTLLTKINQVISEYHKINGKL